MSEEVAEVTAEPKPKKAGRPAGAKRGPGRPPKFARAIAEPAFSEGDVEQAKAPEAAHVFGFPVHEGFAKITVFADASDGNKMSFFTVKLGDYPRLNLARNRMHTLPMAYINVIRDTIVDGCIEDDLSDPANPVRRYVSKTRYPHSDPIPATKEEFVAYWTQQNGLEHPNAFKRRMAGAKNFVA